MASILDRYGIKEVADVTFYEINADGTAGAPVLYLDTLKVSTIEQTGETAEARGGKGNPALISWDYGKEITVSIEDALFSPKSMNLMFGNKGAKVEKSALDLVKTAVGTVVTGGKLPDYFVANTKDGQGKKVVMTGDHTGGDFVAYASSGLTLIGVFNEDGTEVKATEATVTGENWANVTGLEVGDRVFIKYKVSVNASTITISADQFPGTYYVTGDTYVRPDNGGADQYFQFIIPKAKMQVENTITLEAEGDPSVFNMNLKVLRPEDGEMMKLVQYDIPAGA